MRLSVTFFAKVGAELIGLGDLAMWTFVHHFCNYLNLPTKLKESKAIKNKID